MKFLTIFYCFAIGLLASHWASAEKIQLTCDGRDLILDTDTRLLELEVVNNTLLTPDKTYRDIPYTEDQSLVRFRVVGEFYTEGWALDRESMIAASSLTMPKKPEIESVNRRYQCSETVAPEPPEKLPKQKVGKRPRKRGF